MPQMFRCKRSFDLEKLSSEVAKARQILDFKDGPYGHSISLPAAEDVGPLFRDHHNNLPFSSALGDCPYMRSVFDSFHTEKAAFRLLRRTPKSAYALHDDRDKGIGIRRFQIPINTSTRAWILIAHDTTDFAAFEEQATKAAETDDDIWFDLEQLDRILHGQFDLFTLAPGYLYSFDTNQIHTLINADDHERVVLSLDLVENEWLDDWIKSEVTEPVPADPVQRAANINWKWNALRNGLIRNR